jgi:hypothetical protein
MNENRIAGIARLDRLRPSRLAATVSVTFQCRRHLSLSANRSPISGKWSAADGKPAALCLAFSRTFWRHRFGRAYFCTLFSFLRRRFLRREGRRIFQDYLGEEMEEERMERRKNKEGGHAGISLHGEHPKRLETRMGIGFAGVLRFGFIARSY